MTNDVSLVQNQPIRGLNPQDLAELGAMLSAGGFSQLAARALVAKVESVATQVALAVTPDLLDEVRKIGDARMLELIARVRQLPSAMGYVRLDQVVATIQNVAMRSPTR